MLLHATSDGPDRPDASDPEATPERTSDPEHVPEIEPREPSPERPREPEPEIVPSEPVSVPPRGPVSEVDPATPAQSEPREPEVAPADTEEPAPPTPPEAIPASPPGTEPEVSPAIPQPEFVPATAPPEPTPQPPPEQESPDREPPDKESPAEAEAKRPPLQRAVLALLIIATAALIGYAISRPSDRDPGADALDRTVEAAGELRLMLETDTPAQARRFVRDEFGWRVGVPVFEAAPLQGVAIAQTAPAVEVPVFLYSDGAGNDVAVFAYSYALLDQVPDRLRLAAADYDELDDGEPFVRRAGGRDVVLWRDRDDIYVTVTDLPAEALTDGFAMAR